MYISHAFKCLFAVVSSPPPPPPPPPQLLYGCAERMLPLSPAELELAVNGKLDSSILTGTCPLPSTDVSAGGGSGGGATGMSRLDSTSLAIVALLRGKSYAAFTPAERTRLLRGLIDLASATWPIKDHMQASTQACARDGLQKRVSLALFCLFVVLCPETSSPCVLVGDNSLVCG